MNELLDKILGLLYWWKEYATLTLTDFAFVSVAANSIKGVPLGQGRCKAVRLKLNTYNKDTGEVIPFTHFYYGEQKNQEYENLRGQDSKIIYCQDLSQVYVRLPETFSSVIVSGAGTGAANGTYTFRGVNNGKPYYNKVGSLDSLTINAIVWTGTAWIITSAAATTYYTSANNVIYPNLVELWVLATGANPLPTVVQSDNNIAVIQIQKYR